MLVRLCVLAMQLTLFPHFMDGWPKFDPKFEGRLHRVIPELKFDSERNGHHFVSINFS